MTEQKFKTDQEKFWAGDFGREYSKRNAGSSMIASNIAMFADIFRGRGNVSSVLECGANIGLNLAALKTLFPNQTQYAIEINSHASKVLKENVPQCEVFEASVLDFEVDKFSPGTVDLVFTKGVLIHINPNQLKCVYEKLIGLASQYLLICEYFNPNPVSIEYRGFKERLFKRDFAGEILALDSSLSLMDYGFVYHGDSNFPQDDITWFLLGKSS